MFPLSRLRGRQFALLPLQRFIIVNCLYRPISGMSGFPCAADRRIQFYFGIILIFFLVIRNQSVTPNKANCPSSTRSHDYCVFEMASKSDLKEMGPLTTLKDVSAQEDHDEQIAEIVEKSSGGFGFVSRPRRRVLIVLAVIVLVIIIVGVLVGTILRGNSDTDSGKEECKYLNYRPLSTTGNLNTRAVKHW